MNAISGPWGALHYPIPKHTLDALLPHHQAHAVGITVVTILQILYWDGVLPTVRTRLSKPVSLLLALLLLGALLAAALAATVGRSEPSAWLSFLYFLSYEKLFISTIKGVPQAYLNYTRQSTEGWSIHNILCDFTGGFFSVSQLLLDCWAEDDWSGVRGDPLKFGLGLVSMAFDVFFCVQHFILYPDRQRAESRGGRKEDDEDVLV
jgi:cystinosin